MTNANHTPAKPAETTLATALAAAATATTAPAKAEKPELPDLVKLAPGATLEAVVEAVNAIIDRVNTKRDRGPESTRVMTEDDARRIMLGDLKDASHTKAAEALGLSYGQVYSARKGFTFKTIGKEAEKAAPKKS